MRSAKGTIMIRQMDILTNRQPPSQPQLPGLILQLTFRTHYLTRESAQEITYMQSVTLIDAS